MDFITVSTVAAVAATLLVGKMLTGRATVFEHERGLHYRHGKFVSVLAPGSYWYLPFRSTIKTADIRLRYITMVGQEVLSSDNVSLKLSLVASYELANLDTAINKVQAVDSALYSEVQQVAREVIGSYKIDEILEKRFEVSARLQELAEPKASSLGVAMKSLAIRDLTFPGDLKKIFSEVVRAQKQGLAALERARGETAALRNLANAAKLMEGNPTLLQLRLIQSLESGSGNTIIYGTSDTGRVIPVNGGSKSAKPAGFVASED